MARAFSSGTAGPVFGHLLLGLIDLAAGVIALVWPGPTALVLVLVVGIWAFIGGFAEIFAGFGGGETAGTRAMFILAGLVSIAFGVVLFARPGLGAVTLALLFGLFSLIYGVSQIVMGTELHGTGRPCSRSWERRPELAWAWAPRLRPVRRPLSAGQAPDPGFGRAP